MSQMPIPGVDPQIQAACDAFRRDYRAEKGTEADDAGAYNAFFQSVRKTGRLLLVDEAFAPCGIGAEIAAQISDRGFDDLDAPIRRLNGAHTPTPYSPPLENAVVPNVNAIVKAIRDLVAE